MSLLKIYFVEKMKRFLYYEKRKMDLKKEEYEWQRNLILFFSGSLFIKEIYAKLNMRIVKDVKGHFCISYICWSCRCIMCVDVMQINDEDNLMIHMNG